MRNRWRRATRHEVDSCRASRGDVYALATMQHWPLCGCYAQVRPRPPSFLSLKSHKTSLSLISNRQKQLKQWVKQSRHLSVARTAVADEIDLFAFIE